MSKIAKVFADLKVQGRKGLVPFITAGDPEPGITLELMHALVRGGADVIELGVPFSDPMADGPELQKELCLTAPRSSTVSNWSKSFAKAMITPPWS
jgi:tryptophan synthase alpha chain